MRINSPVSPRSKFTRPSSFISFWAQKRVILQGISAFLGKYHLLILITLGAVFIILETIEHVRSVATENSFYWGEVLLIILLLGCTEYLTRMLLAALAERSQVIHTLRYKHDLVMQLSASQDINEMSRRLIHQIASILPVVGIQLYLYEKNKSWFIQGNHLAEDGSESHSKKDDFLFGLDPHRCRRCLAQNRPELHPLKTCNQLACILYIQTPNGYCLPLVHGSRPVGLLHLYAPAHQGLSKGQMEILENIAIEISSSLYTSIVNKEREEELLAQKIRTVQLDIARDLHDTIGQNISYLRMKLDILSELDSQTKTDTTREIKHMSEVANESYDLVRGTLAVLQTGSSADLLQLFTRYADQVAERSTFQIDFTSQGKPKPLPTNQMRQLFYIFREAISNIEKYANASQVCVEMIWDEDSLSVVISDNGCGFDQNQVQYGNHYGLTFMKERTQQINGSLSILSTIGAGTNIVVHAPYE